MKKVILLLVCMLCLLSAITAQESLKSLEEEYYDFLSIQGKAERPTLGYRTLSDSEWLLTDRSMHLWSFNNLGKNISVFTAENPSSNFFLDGINQGVTIRVYGPEWYNSYNTLVPYGYNDGALWQGVGYNTSFSTGLRLEGYGFEATFKPFLTFSQNKDWNYLKGPYGGQYGYFSDIGYIDIVQRYGDKALQAFSWGDSEIRWTWNTFTVGFGTQTPWLGPAWLNPMLGSNNADPYPKFDIGLRKTSVVLPWLDWYLGDVEGRLWVGKLSQSKYFDGPRNEDRMITMCSASYSPSFINGLTVGFNRLYLNYWKLDNLSYIKRLFINDGHNGTATDNDEDQKVSLFADWVLPDSGFEVYGEFGIDDYAYVVTNPFHTAIYTLGVKQAVNHTDNLTGMINLEWNNFEMSQDYQMQQRYGGYYFHGQVKQGYTNNGQIVGAATGSFGNSQYLSYTLYYPKGKTVLFGHRYCPDNNYLYNKTIWGTPTDTGEWFGLFETYLVGGIETTYFICPSLSINCGARVIIDNLPLFSKNRSDKRTSYNATFGMKYSF